MGNLVSVLVALWLSLSPGAADPLVVATKESPPFSFKQSDGTWAGTSIELWRDVADELQVDYEFEEADLDSMLAGVAVGNYDVGVAAITVTSEREQVLDFTHPFHTTGLAIALTADQPSTLMAIFGVVTSSAFLGLVLALGVVLLAVGVVIWVVERRGNEQFRSQPRAGIGDGFWWSAVTMTTVGYGDKTPKSAVGRVIALAWMLASIVIISTFTATIASSLTVAELSSRVSSADDLVRLRVGTVVGTTSEAYLRAQRLDFRTYGSAEEGLAALTGGEIEAFVYDAPLLRRAITGGYTGRVRILPNTFERQDYAFALPTGSPLRERINQILPSKIRAAVAE